MLDIAWLPYSSIRPWLFDVFSLPGRYLVHIHAFVHFSEQTARSPAIQPARLSRQRRGDYLGS